MDVDRAAAVTYRTASEADAVAASGLITLALQDLDRKAGRPPREQPPEVAVPALRHLTRTDGERFWVAEAQETPVGFGVGMVRGSTDAPGRLWFLAGLFIHPDWQRRGIGRALLERALAGFPAPDGVLAVATSAASTQSNTLYARYGMCPLLPMISLSRALPAPSAPAQAIVGETGAGEGPHAGRGARAGEGAGAGALPPAVAGLDARRLEAVLLTHAASEGLRAVDQHVLGVDRTVDHEWLLGEMGRAGWLFLRAGVPAGYGYLGGDGSQVPDQVGPLAAVDAADQPAMAAFLLDRAAETGWVSATFVLPGANLELQRYLWSHGFVMSGTSELFGASRPFGRFDRYVFVGDALM
jgi:GNAT superfamily N-acetyltransferase